MCKSYCCLLGLMSIALLSSCEDDSLKFKLPEDPITAPPTFAEGKRLIGITSHDETVKVSFTYNDDGSLSELRTGVDVISFDYDPFNVMNGTRNLTSAIHHGLFTDFGTWGQADGSMYSYSHQTIYDKSTHEYLDNAFFENDIYKFYWSELNIERVVRRQIVDGKTQTTTYIIDYHNKPNRNICYPGAFAVLDIVPFRYGSPWFIMSGYLGDGTDNLPSQVEIITKDEDGATLSSHTVEINYKFLKGGLIDTETITTDSKTLRLQYSYE